LKLHLFSLQFMCHSLILPCGLLIQDNHIGQFCVSYEPVWYSFFPAYLGYIQLFKTLFFLGILLPNIFFKLD